MEHAVQILRRTWVFQYYAEEGRLRWRKAEDLPPAVLRLDSPYDTEAHSQFFVHLAPDAHDWVLGWVSSQPLKNSTNTGARASGATSCV